MSVPRLSVDNPIGVNLLMWVLLISGAYSCLTMVREFFPPLELEQISIRIAWPGATPQDVERAIALRLEREIRDIDDIEEIHTSVFEGMCVITITLDDSADRDRVLNAIRSEVDQAKPELPDTADDPEIVEVRPFVPVLAVVVSGDVGEIRLREAALRVRDDLLDLDDVSEIALLGLRRREIVAEVQPEILEEHRLTFEQVGRTVASSNLDLPGGQIKSERGNVRLRTMGESRAATGVESIPVANGPDGAILRLRDIARVREGFEDRVLRGSFDGKPAIQLMVFKTPEQDALKIAEQVKRYVRENSPMLGGAVRLDTTTDLSLLIEGRLDLMIRNAVAGGVLVLLTLSMFLSLRTAFWVATGLVVALLGTFTVMDLLGSSINLISLFSLIVVLGLIVDDAVVIGEAVHRRIQDGMPLRDAAIAGATEMAPPVLVAVFTSIAAFAPLYFMEGIWGKFLGEIPLVVSSALAVSLIEAFAILPAHLGHSRFLLFGLKDRIEGRPERRYRLADWRDRWFDRAFHRGFDRALRFVLHNRYPAIAASVGFSLFVAGLVKGGVIPFVLLQEVDAEMITVRLEMAPGTTEERTTEVIENIAREARTHPEVKSVFTVVGLTLSDRGRETPADPATVGQLSIELSTADERERSGQRTSVELIEALRAASADIAGVDKLQFRAEAGSPQGPDIEVRVRGIDLAQASDAADDVARMLRDYTGVREIEKDLREGKLEARLRLLDSARALGLTTADLARQVRHAMFGFEAQELQEADDEVKVRVVLPEDARRRLSDLDRLRIATAGGARVPLAEAAGLSTERGYATLHRVDARQAVTVSAEVDENSGANVQEITRDLAGRLDLVRDRYPGVTLSFEGRQKETMDSVGSLFRGFPAAVLIIYAMIAILFSSYLQPVLVMVVIPYAFVGAVLGHLFMGLPFTLLSVIGGVALSGIVVNDSLILVDRVNRNRRAGMSRFDAVIEGATSRLRPIVLTTVTTVAGLSPLMTETSFQAQFLIPMAVSIVFGLVFATVVTLLILPTFYMVVEDVRRLVRG